MRAIGVLPSSVVVVAMALVLSGCGGSDPAAAPTKPAATAAKDIALKEISGCIRPSDATLFRHARGDVTADVALFGKGATVAVVTYELHGSVCTWVPLAKKLAGSGHQVLLYKPVINEGADQIKEMVKLARQRGARHIVLVGGSMGGEESIAAGSVVKPAVDAVVALSPASISGEDAAALDVPFLQIVALGDTGFADSARTNEAAATSPDHRLLVIPGAEHASMMFAGAEGPRVLKTIVGFVDKVAG